MKNNIIDSIKLICCILIVGSHCLPLFKADVTNYYYGQWFFRFCVPLFFISTGYFYSRMRMERKRNYIGRIILLYIISTLIYTPLFYKAGLTAVLNNLIFGYRHLWYLSALAIGLILFLAADRILKEKKYLLTPILLGGGYC